jgi:citrate lyase alpha subunit
MEQDVAADNGVEQGEVGIIFHCALSEGDIAVFRVADALVRKGDGLRVSAGSSSLSSRCHTKSLLREGDRDLRQPTSWSMQESLGRQCPIS